MALIAKLALVIACAIAHLAAGAEPPSGPGTDAALHIPGTAAADPLFCVVVRTYWGHGDDAGGGLRRLLRSLQRQTHQRWEAVLLVVDVRPFPEMHRIVADLNDTRIWIGQAFKPRQGASWAPNYHGLLYNLTDDALAVCPRGTAWALATNGDNEYAPDFMAAVVSEADKARKQGNPAPDVVAFDFYSRYQRITAAPCARFAARPAPAPACKPNRMTWCHVDLGSYVMNWGRLRAEGRRFGDLQDGSDRLLNADSADGLMAEAIVAAGWTVAHVTGRCMFAHAPSFQACAWGGGVWDDRDVMAPAGGSCLTPAQADAALRGTSDVEMVTVEASHDGRAGEGFEGAAAGALAAAPCLRRRDWAAPGRLGLARVWFSRHCAAEEDLVEFDASMREWFPTEEALEGAADTARDHVAQAASRRGG